MEVSFIGAPHCGLKGSVASRGQLHKSLELYYKSVGGSENSGVTFSISFGLWLLT